jgi:hypothetical protein
MPIHFPFSARGHEHILEAIPYRSLDRKLFSYHFAASPISRRKQFRRD